MILRYSKGKSTYVDIHMTMKYVKPYLVILTLINFLTATSIVIF